MSLSELQDTSNPLPHALALLNGLNNYTFWGSHESRDHIYVKEVH